MKKIFSLALLLIMFIPTKSQTSCATAINFSNNDTCITGNSLSGSEMWFKFTADSSSVYIGTNRTGGNTYLQTIEVFSGTCAGLTLKSTSNAYCDSSVSLTVNTLTATSTYYIKVTTITNGTCNFNICIQNITALGSCTPSCALISNPSFEINGITGYHYSPFEYGLVNCWFAGTYTPQVAQGGV